MMMMTLTVYWKSWEFWKTDMKLDPIVALATSLQTQAISICRLSGDDAIEIAEKLTHLNLKNQDHKITYGFIHDPLTDEEVDEVLVLVMKGPRSYTREDVVEIHSHGGIYVTQKILSLILGAGARLARPGEFTQRAVLNGRIDLAQAEGVNALIDADSAQSAKLALNQLKGSLSALSEPLKEELLTIIAHIEVNIDYPEYDIEQVTRTQLLPLCLDFRNKLVQILKEAQSGQRMREGVKTAIIGRPNVGKSSLLNALLNEDKAIVTEIPGTTRDVVEGTIRLDKVTLHLMDTAGIRESEDRIEKLGIEKTKQIIKAAELILFVVDGSQPLDEEEKVVLKTLDPDKTLVIYNKKDLSSKSDRLEVSALNKDISALTHALNARYEADQFVFTKPVLNNERTIGLVRQALASMDSAIQAIKEDTAVDLINLDLTAAYEALVGLTNTENNVSIADELFARFCLGK
jgi:tRNA modification GTPase